MRCMHFFMLKRPHVTIVYLVIRRSRSSNKAMWNALLKGLLSIKHPEFIYHIERTESLKGYLDYSMETKIYPASHWFDSLP